MVRTYIKQAITTFAIDNGVPLPQPTKQRPTNKRHIGANTLRAMNVGDSVYCPDKQVKNKLQCAASYLRRDKTSQLRFTIRKHENGWRIWRLPDAVL